MNISQYFKNIKNARVTNSEARRPLGPDCTKWYLNVPFGAYGDHGPNICIESGAPANRRRAEGCVYVLGKAFTVQRALCTFGSKGHPCRRPPLSRRNGQTLEPIRLNLKGAKGCPKLTQRPALQDLVPVGQS